MKTTLLLILSVFTISLSFGQNTYYVSPSGSNSNYGSQASPWQTIQYGLNQMSYHDSLFVLPGLYHEKINIPIDSIFFGSLDLNNKPVIDALGLTGQNPIINISYKNNITVYGLELKNNIQNDAQGILVEGACYNIKLAYCSIHDIHFSSNANDSVSDTTNAQGIIAYGTDIDNPIRNLNILNCEVYNCRLGYSEGIAVNGNVEVFSVLGNKVHDLTNIGIDIIGHEGVCPFPTRDQARYGFVSLNEVHDCVSPYATSGGIYIDGARNITVQRNKSYRNGYGIEVGCESVNNTTDSIMVSSNLIFKNEMCAIALGGYDYPSGSGKVTHSSILNNTCYFNDVSNSGLGELFLTYSQYSILENNIFYTSPSGYFAYGELNSPFMSFDYNVVYNTAGDASTVVDWNGSTYMSFSDFITASNTNSHSIFAIPFNADPSTDEPNIILQVNSPAINAGNPAYIPNSHDMDYFGQLRMEGGRIDCGADEYGTSVGVFEKIQNSFLIYPNPAAQSIDLISGQPIEQYGIYALTGEKVISGTGQTADISGLNAGLYFVRVYSGNSVSVEKFEKR